MKAVWKYEIPIDDSFIIAMPREAKLLCIMVQHGQPQLWALVDPTLAVSERRFRLAGTGHEIDEDIRSHVGSFQMIGGDLVFHVFEIAP